MQGINKKNIKEVKTEGENIIIEFQRKVIIDKKKLQIMWKILKQKENALFVEKENIQEIAKQAKIVLE